MKIAIIGSGNVGGALAQKWIGTGHEVVMGARQPLSDKSGKLADIIGKDKFASVAESVRRSDKLLKR